MKLEQVCVLLGCNMDEFGVWQPGMKYKINNPWIQMGNNLVVQLSSDIYMIVDKSDAVISILKSHIWCFNRDGKIEKGYAITNIKIDGKKTNRKFHQLLMNYEKPLVCDHINRNPTDNRTCNLRIITGSGNSRNRSIPSNNTSGYKGVYKCHNGWRSTIVDNNGNKLQQWYNINNLGDEALMLARAWRLYMEEELGYTTIKKDL